MAIQSRKMPPWEFCLSAKTRCNAGWLVSKGGGFAPQLAIVERLGGDWGGGVGHIRPYIGCGTGAVELGTHQRSLRTGGVETWC